MRRKAEINLVITTGITSMRRILLGLAFAALAFFPAAAQSTGQHIWTLSSGQWDVVLERHPSDGFRCKWQTVWRGPDGRASRYMAFALRPSGIALVLNAVHGNYRLDAIEGQRIGLVVDGMRYSGVVDYTSRDSVATVASNWIARGADVRDFVDGFARANTATVELPGGVRWNVGLQGTMASLPIMSQCLGDAARRNGR